MTRIVLFEHPFSCVQPQVFEVDSIAVWLLHHYGHVPHVKVQVFVGAPSAESEITARMPDLLAGDQPEYTVLQSPGFESATWAIISLVVSVGSVLLTPKPEMPNAAYNRTQASPNNALAARENKVRMLERVEDIYGTVRAIPSLMMPTYNKYIGHQKYEYGYYCVSRGYCTVAELKDGDTLISDISGASAAVYFPFASPNSGTAAVQVGSPILDPIITAARAIEVDGITLKAPNQVQLPATGIYTFTPDVAGGVITQASKNPNFSACADVGEQITVVMAAAVNTISAGVDYDGTPYATVALSAAATTFFDYVGYGLFDTVSVGDTITTSGFANSANNGSFTVASKLSDYAITVTAYLVSESAAAVTLAVSRDYSGTYSIIAVGDGFIRLNPADTWGWTSVAADVSATVHVNGHTNYTDWVTLPDLERTQVWLNVTAPNGIYFDQGGNKLPQTVTFEAQIEQLHPSTLAPLGVVQTIASQLDGNVTDERAITLEHTTAWAGPARVRMRRTHDYPFGASGTVMDEIKWADLYSITPVDKLHFGNKTTVHTITQATARATAVKTRQLNCLASRLLPTYNGSTFSGALNAQGQFESGVLSATAKLCDIIAAVSVDPKIGARVLADDVDMAQIWAVQQQLDAWHAECGQFHYTFDTDNTSFEETLTTIANAGFCIAYRQNGKIRLAFDKLQANSAALFTHRNKKPHSETITRTFASDADYDGVQFVYVDPESDTSETITLPLDGSATKLKKFEIAGIRSYTQAWYRASREYAKLQGQRITLETTTTLDARALLPNARIDVVDNTRFKSYDGEVVGQSGLELTLSQDVAFAPSTTHSIVLMRRDGSLQSIPCTAGSAANRVVLQSLPSEAIVTEYGAAGIRTIFSFAADSARGAMAYLVQEIDITDSQYVTLRAVNYSAAYYAGDTASVPAKATVIN